MAYEYEGKFISLLDRLDEEERYFIFRGIDDELKEVYAKAKAFDEIVSEFDHYVDTLPSWESIDHKDTQTLLEIIKEYMEDK